MRAQEVFGKLEEENYKLTSQRREIIRTFLQKAGQHPSAEDMYAWVGEKDSEVGLATVYRTLSLLVDLGVARAIDFGDGVTRYEIVDELDEHHHLICNECGSVYEVKEKLLADLERKVSEEADFVITSHSIKFYGICSQCRKGRIDDRDANSE